MCDIASWDLPISLFNNRIDLPGSFPPFLIRVAIKECLKLLIESQICMQPYSPMTNSKVWFRVCCTLHEEWKTVWSVNGCYFLVTQLSSTYKCPLICMYLLKPGPESKIICAHHIINMPNMTHWGLSINMGKASSSSSSGKTGASLSTVVSRLTVDTVTSRRNAVSTSEHLLTGLQCKMEVPRGIKMAARAQSTMAWWNKRPWLHLRDK